MPILNHPIFREMSGSQDPSESAVIRHQVVQLTEADYGQVLQEWFGKSVSDRNLPDLICLIIAV